MKTHGASSDEDLMKAYQNGDFSSFEILYERHRARVFGFLVNKLRNRYEAEEVFQGTFMKLHSSRKHYDPSFKFAPWLFTVCQSVLKDHLRKKMRILEDNNEEILSQAHGSPASDIVSPISLESLEGNQRRALELRYTEDLSFNEIAEKLKTSPGNVRQLVSRAIKKMRKERDQGDL